MEFNETLNRTPGFGDRTFPRLSRAAPAAASPPRKSR